MMAFRKFSAALFAAVLSVGVMVSAAVTIGLVTASQAEAAVVRSIDVRGNSRIDDATVRNYINIRPGKEFGPSDINDAVKRLYDTGLFGDVRIVQQGSVLVITVDERSIVNQVIFQGNKKIKDDKLAEAVGLKPRESFSQSQLDADIETVRRAYAAIGREDATVTASTMPLGEGRVNVVFQINEGDRTKIATLNFVGNNAYSNRRLADVISTKRSGLLSFILRNDVYDEAKLRADEEALRRFYFNRGYADFQVISSSAELDESKNEYTINITVDEGQRYTFGSIDVETTIDGIDPQSLRSAIKTYEGRTYNASEVEETLIALTERVAARGYAFAQVTPRGNRDFANRTISVTYSIDEGARAYVERIEIRGNARTRDYVIRREFDVSEGDAFNQVLIQRAKKRLEALDFFQSVDISTVQGSGSDQVVLVVTVVEKSTGELGVGAGYTLGGQTDDASSGFSVEGSISERNFLGRGQFIRFSAAAGTDSRDFMFSFTEPYFLGRRIAAGFDIYRQSREYDNYDSELTGATVRFGLPITQNLTNTVAYNISSERYSYNDDTDDVCPGPYSIRGDTSLGCPVAQAIQQAIGAGSWLKSSVSNTLTYNTLDNMKIPRDGFYITGTAEFAGLGGDAEFVKLTGSASYYRTLLEEQDLVGMLTVGGGHVFGYGGANSLRVFDLFQSSSRIIRGFQYNGIGPVDQTTGERLGGETYFNGTAELQAPLPLVPESFGFRVAAFADAASIHGNRLANVDPSSIDASIRASVGASLIWASPFGPLRVDFAYPIIKKKTDAVQHFNFGISTRF
jgi:outer membrane protein insertion porin family